MTLAAGLAAIRPQTDTQAEKTPTADALKPYQYPILSSALGQLLTSVVPYGACLCLMVWSLGWSYLLTCLLAFPAAGFYLRSFMVLHDCAHSSFLASKKANRVLGFLLGVLTLAPFGYWKRTHLIHHATSGDLERRHCGDVKTLTVSEYEALTPARKRLYRLYRHPAFMMGIGVFLLFLVFHRYPWSAPGSWKREWLSVHMTNAALALALTAVALTIGLETAGLVLLPVLLIASTCGAWLVYVQHQFDTTYWRLGADWDFRKASLEGSSYFELPRLLQWFSANIGFHHIHHLNPRIPNYRLEECFREVTLVQDPPRITLRQSFRLGSLKLWDEERGRLTGFPKKADNTRA